MSAFQKASIRYAAVGEPGLLVLEVPPEIATGEVQCASYAIPIMARRNGMLLCVPVGVLSADALELGNAADDDSLLGPSLRGSAPLIEELEDGAVQAVGVETEFIVADFDDRVLEFLRDYDPAHDAATEIMPFYSAAPSGLPDFEKVLDAVKNWTNDSEISRANFYSAREEQDGPPLPKVPKTKKGAQPKRVTTATLAEQVATLTSQMQTVMSLLQSPQTPAVLREQRDGHATHAQEQTVAALATLGPSVPKIPALSSALAAGPRASPKDLTHLVGPPPRAKVEPVKLAEEGNMDFPDEEMVDPLSPTPDPMLAALTGQSSALQTLVAHLAGQSSDPMVDLALTSSGSSASSTRGIARREKMVSSLAMGTSSFWLQFQQQLCHRMHPSKPVPKSDAEVKQLGLSLYSYLERFGGFKGQRDLGLILWIVCAAVDSAAAEDWARVREHLSLLVCSLEQAAMDGTWETAFLISLAPDPPSQLFQDRISNMSGMKAFCPIMPTEWAATHLAYLKELDILPTRKSEIKKAPRPGKAAPEDAEKDASPKRKPRFPKKPKASEG